VDLVAVDPVVDLVDHHLPRVAYKILALEEVGCEVRFSVVLVVPVSSSSHIHHKYPQRTFTGL
jgi:hypothetical protein